MQTLVARSDGDGQAEKQVPALRKTRFVKTTSTVRAERESDPLFPKEPRQVLPLLVPCPAVRAEISQPCSGRATGRPELERVLAMRPRSWIVPMGKLRPRSHSREVVQGLRCSQTRARPKAQ